MAKVAVVGGHGKIALQLHPLLVAAGHVPVALVRSDSYRAELEELGAEVRLLDIESSTASDFAAAFAGIPVGRTRTLGFLLCAFMAGIAGLLGLAFFTSGDPTSGGGRGARQRAECLEQFALGGFELG